MPIIPENPRSRNLLAVAIVVVGLAAVYQQLVWTPQNAENSCWPPGSTRSTR